MNHKPLEILTKIKVAIEKVGYECVLMEKSAVLPMDMLNVALGDETCASEQLLNVSVFPLADELDGSHFVQFYAQYPFVIDKAQYGRLFELLSEVNMKLPLGHFNVSLELSTVYFKYVLVLADDGEVNAVAISDLLDMCVFAIDNHAGEFAVLN